MADADMVGSIDMVLIVLGVVHELCVKQGVLIRKWYLTYYSQGEV